MSLELYAAYVLACIVIDSHDDRIGPELRAILAHPPTLVLESAGLSGNREFHLWFTALAVCCRIEYRKMLTGNFIGSVLLNALSTGIPSRYVSTAVEEKNCVVTNRINQIAEDSIGAKTNLTAMQRRGGRANCHSEGSS